MTRYFTIVSLLLLLFACSSHDKTEEKIKEIYFRVVNPGSYSKVKSEVLILLDNNQGYRFLDSRPITQIDHILDDKIWYLASNSFTPDLVLNVSKIDRTNVDYTNFVLVISDPFYYNQIYKCHYDKSLQKLKFKRFVIENGDTLMTREPSDTSSVYSFIAGTKTIHAADLDFPDPDKVSNRDITNEKTGVKASLPLEQEIANYVHFKKTTIKPESYRSFEKNKFALRFTESGPDGQGGEYGITIEILEDYAFISFKSTGGKSIESNQNRRLTPREIKEIMLAIDSANLEGGELSVPTPINDYRCGYTYLILKNRKKLIAGGVLNPLEIHGTLLRASDDIESTYNQCRAYSSTLKGNYDLVFDAILKPFDQFDSLHYGIMPNKIN